MIIRSHLLDLELALTFLLDHFTSGSTQTHIKWQITSNQGNKLSCFSLRDTVPIVLYWPARLETDKMMKDSPHQDAAKPQLLSWVCADTQPASPQQLSQDGDDLQNINMTFWLLRGFYLPLFVLHLQCCCICFVDNKHWDVRDDLNQKHKRSLNIERITGEKSINRLINPFDLFGKSERESGRDGKFKHWLWLLDVINIVWFQFSSHRRLRPFAANIAKVNQSYSESVSISPASLFCFEICFWKLAAVCEKLSCCWVSRSQNSCGVGIWQPWQAWFTDTGMLSQGQNL